MNAQHDLFTALNPKVDQQICPFNTFNTWKFLSSKAAEVFYLIVFVCQMTTQYQFPK